MIPALLSCLFVLYLYRTLNEPDTIEQQTGLSASESQSEIDALERQLVDLRQRLERLSGVVGEGADK